MKELKDMTWDELLSEQTGRALMMLGEGKNLRSIVFSTMDIALQWKRDQEKKEVQ